MGALLALVFWMAFIWGIVKFYKWLFKGSQPAKAVIPIPRPPDPRIINRQKHSCKCYRENLTPGEKEVAEVLERELSYKDYFIFNNVTIPRQGIGSTQIDHVVVSRYGIFVIETKDYGGWIWGSQDQTTWTQTLPGNNHYKLQNPCRQNAGHLVALQAYMPEFTGKIESIIVFTDRCEFMTERIQNVFYLSELIQGIKRYQQPRLTENGMQYAIGKLAFQCQTNDISAEEHAANIQAFRALPRQAAPQYQGVSQG